MAEPTDLYLTVMANWDVWAVPVMVIAKNRAENYKDEFGGDIDCSLAEDTLPYFARVDAEVYDWAQNNMDWSDVSPHAFLYQKAEKTWEDWEESWCSGRHDIVKAAEAGHGAD